MKKVFAILAIAGMLVACNSGGEKKEEVKDTTAAPAPAPAPATDSTAVKADSTAAPAAAPAVDSTKK